MSVSDKIKDIFEKHVMHRSFLEKDSVLSCMDESYKLGKTESLSGFEKMSLLFEELIEDCEKNNENEFCPKILSIKK